MRDWSHDEECVLSVWVLLTDAEVDVAHFHVAYFYFLALQKTTNNVCSHIINEAAVAAHGIFLNELLPFALFSQADGLAN